MLSAELISIGDELLIGQVINTNASYLSKELNSLGIAVNKVTTVGDDRRAILRSFKSAWKENDIVIVTGGLGPTHDDISKDAVAAFFDRPLVLDKKVLAAVRKRFESYGYKQMPEANVSQAMVPKGFTVLKNEVGTAPGLLYHEKGKSFVILPGVPFEMEWLWTNVLERELHRIYRSKLEAILHKTILTTGVGESKLAELIGPVDQLLEPGATLASLPKSTGVRLRVTVKAPTAKEAAKKVKRIEGRIRAKADRYIYGTDEESLEAHIVRLLTERSETLSTAESCTGGMVSSLITSIPGSSASFVGGVVSYDNAVKVRELGVKPATLKKQGAVSEETARQMAEGARTRLKSTYALSVTGIAGPDGATAGKPLGTTWIALARKGKPTITKHYVFAGNRTVNRERAAATALEMLRRTLLGMEQ